MENKELFGRSANLRSDAFARWRVKEALLWRSDAFPYIHYLYDIKLNQNHKSGERGDNSAAAQFGYASGSSKETNDVSTEQSADLSSQQQGTGSRDTTSTSKSSMTDTTKISAKGKKILTLNILNPKIHQDFLIHKNF